MIPHETTATAKQKAGFMLEDKAKNNNKTGQGGDGSRPVSSGMNSLSLFLKKFIKVLSSGVEERKIVAEEITNTTNIKIPLENVSLKRGVVFVSARPVAKNEIFINKEKILQAISKRGLLGITDLR